MNLSKLNYLFVGAIACCSLQACFSPVKTDTVRTFLISDTPVHVAKRHRRPVTLMVLSPETVPAYNTTNIAYSKCKYLVAYYGKNAWAATPSQMLQPLIVDTLQRTNAFKAVVSSPYPGRYQYFLRTEILRFEQDFTVTPALFRLEVRSQLNRVASASVVATKKFKVSVPVYCPPYGGIVAGNQAVKLFLSQLSSFATKRIK